MSRTTSSQSGIGGAVRSSRTVAALHESGGRWRIVVAQGSPFRLLETRTLAAGATKELEEVIHRLRVERIVRLVPGPRTIARCVSIPQAAPAEAASALMLIAEAELPESIPSHRRAAGVIPDVLREGSQTGLLTGWPGREGEPAASPVSRGIRESWAAEASAFARALRGDGGVAAFANSERGSIAILAAGPTRTVARVLVEDNSTPPAWSESIQRALAETCRSAGVEDPPEMPGDRPLLLTEAARTALAGPSGGKAREPGWLDDYGLALGAAMLALSEHSAQRALTEMTAEARRERRPVAERALSWLSVRRNAWMAATAALVALFVLPLGLAWARLAVLEGKVQTLHEQEGSREELARSAALYEQLQRTRWPMTKLLADVSGALPVGVRVESIRLAPDQGLGVEATADSADAESAFLQNLNKTGIFRGVQISRSDTGAGGSVSFEVTAEVASPFLNAKPVEDYAAQPLAVRLYGEGATNTNWSADSDKAVSSHPGRPERPSRPAGAPEDSGKGEDDSGPSAPSRPTGSGSDEVPEAVTDDQIKAMDRSAAMKAWSQRKKIMSTRKDLDQATKERLASEVDKLKAQMDAKKGEPAK